MKYQAIVIEAARVAIILMNSVESSDQVRREAEGIIKDFPEKLDFKEPKKGKKIFIQVEQIG